LETNKKRFGIFGSKKEKKDATPENRAPTLRFFFKTFVRKFPQLLRLNVLMIFQMLPLIAIAIVFLAGDKTPASTSASFAPLYGINQSISTPNASALLDMSSVQMGLPVFSTTMNFIILGLAIFMALTWGWQNIGATYVIRGLVRGDAVFVFSDFFYGIKKNLKQGFLFGLTDLVFSAVLVIDFLFFYSKTGTSFGNDFMYFVIFALAIIYFIMRFYIYHLLITFDMQNFKIIKNAFIFSILGIKRNIMGLLGIVAFVALHIALIMLLISGPLGFIIILPAIYLLAVTAFMAGYASYPIIDRYLIAPYAEEETEEFIYLTPDKADTTEE
jgi:uncharacterized membrane protein YesL